MRTFELDIFIDRPRNEVYNHLSEPINMIGLTPNMTSIDVVKEQKDASEVILRTFYTMHTYKWLGLPVRKERVYWVIHLTRPYDELEFHQFQKKNTQIIFQYTFQESEEWRTHLIQRVRFAMKSPDDWRGRFPCQGDPVRRERWTGFSRDGS